GWALIHSTWQLGLVAALAASVDVLLRRRSAQARYVAATVALMLMVALPAATFAVVKAEAPATGSGGLPSVRAAAFPAEAGPASAPAREAPSLTAAPPGASSRPA